MRKTQFRSFYKIKHERVSHDYSANDSCDRRKITKLFFMPVHTCFAKKQFPQRYNVMKFGKLNITGICDFCTVFSKY